MTTIAQKIEAGAVLIATPPQGYDRSWRYTLDKAPVMLRPEDMIEVERSPLISMELVANKKIRYYRTTQEQIEKAESALDELAIKHILEYSKPEWVVVGNRKARRAAFREEKRKRGVK